MDVIGKVYDGRWKVLKKIKTKYELQNIYNERVIRVDERTIKKIENGETTISKVIQHNIQFHK